MGDKKPSTQTSLEGSDRNEGEQSETKVGQQPKSTKEQIKRKFFAPRASVSSVDSLDLVRMNASPSTRKRWTTLDTAGRSLLVLSAVLLLAGIIITVFGFTDLQISPTRQLPMQIIGPACLMATAVMWVVGGVFCRLWTIEMKRQKHSMELRTRVQLHALAMDMLKKPQIFSSQALEDPRIRRQLLLKLRQQNALDTSSLDSNSRRSSRVPSIDARSRHSHSGSMAGFLPGFGGPPFGGVDRRRSTEASIGGGSIILPAQFDLPGIHISRIETLDFDDMSMLSGFGQLGPRRYIIIESDGSSEYSKMSIPNSECSFSVCSRSSRSRSSRDSSNFGSRVWDFSSPRESDWEVNAQYAAKSDAYNYSANPRHASVTSAVQAPGSSTSFLSPSMPRKGSTVTFDANEAGFRRHSSPASSFRRKDGRSGAPPTVTSVDTNLLSTVSAKKRDSFGAAGNGRNEIPTTWLFANQPSFYGAPTFRKKSAGDQSLMSIVIDENDGDEDEEEEKRCKDEKCDPKDESTDLPGKEASVSSFSSKGSMATTRAQNFQERRKQSVWEDPFCNQEKRRASSFGITTNTASISINNNNNNNDNETPEEGIDKAMTGISASPLLFGQRKNLVSSPKGKGGFKILRRFTGEKNKEELTTEEGQSRKAEKYDRLGSNDSGSMFSNIAGSIISNLYSRSPETARSIPKAGRSGEAKESDDGNRMNNPNKTTTTTSEKSKIKNFFSSFVK